MHPETLDIENFDSLACYLQDSGRVGAGERPRMSVLAGGVSNRTVLVERASGESWVVKQALPKLRVPVDWFSSPERIEREGQGLRWLPLLTWQGASPELVFEDPARYLLAMRAVPQPHENWKSMLLAGRIEPDHVRQFGELLGALHANGYRMRGELAAVFENRSFFESLRLEPYYSYTATVVPEAAPFLNALIADTLATRLTVVHGDYSPKNVLVYQGRLVLLDHEVIHFGDPAFDIGFSMAHLLSKAHHLAHAGAAFAAAAGAYWAAYLEAVRHTPLSGCVEAPGIRHTLGCLLARVAGRSRLEYLSTGEQARQRATVLRLMAAPPGTIPHLIRTFTESL